MMFLTDFLRAVQIVVRRGVDSFFRDRLTGLYCYDEALRRGSISFRKYAKKGLKMTVVMIDLDELKEVNDTAGYDKRDELIKGVASMVMMACRSRTFGREKDICGRYYERGDEIVVFMHCPEEGARLFIKRIRSKADLIGMRFSFGVAEIRDGEFDHAVKDAVMAMKEDKKSRKGDGR